MALKIINRKPFDLSSPFNLRMCTLRQIDASMGFIEFYNYSGSLYDEKTHKIEVCEHMITSININNNSLLLRHIPCPNEVKNEENVRKMITETNSVELIFNFYYNSDELIRILDWTIYGSDVIIALDRKTCYDHSELFVIPIECLYYYSK